MADNKQSRESIDYRRKDGDPEEMYIGVDKAKHGVDFSAITVKVEVDVSEAITGLKALQREAKEATKALRELETDLTHLSTKALSKELEKREGVTSYRIDTHGTYAKLTLDNVETGGTIFIEGPAVIHVNKD